MEDLLTELETIAKTSLLAAGLALLGGVLLSCLLATLIVRARILRGHLDRPFSFWRFVSRLLLWGSVSALGVTLSASAAAYWATERILSSGGQAIQRAAEPYVGELQAQVNTLLHRRRGSGYTFNALVSDASGLSSTGSPLTEEIAAQINAELISRALRAVGINLDRELPHDLSRLDLTNLTSSVVGIASVHLRRVLWTAALPILLTVKLWLGFLLLWGLADKVLSILARAARRRIVSPALTETR